MLRRRCGMCWLRRWRRTSGWRRSCGRSMNSLVTGLGRQGAEVAPGTLAGACAQAGTLLVPLEEAITARSRGSWHLHADERDVAGPCPARGRRPGEVVAVSVPRPGYRLLRHGSQPCRDGPGRHAGIGTETGQPTADDGGGPRRLVISSDFYAFTSPPGRKRRPGEPLLLGEHPPYFVRAGDANPAQLTCWTAAWLDRTRRCTRRTRSS
jgi:transposase